MNNDLYIVEYEWWQALFVRLVLVTFSVYMIGAWYVLKDVVVKRELFDLYVYLSVGLTFLSGTLWSLLSLPSVPRLLFFREVDIRIVGPLGRERVFPYAELSRVVIRTDIPWSEMFKRRPFEFGAVLYFRNDTIKVMFNHRGMPDFNELVAFLKTKAIVIEQ